MDTDKFMNEIGKVVGEAMAAQDSDKETVEKMLKTLLDFAEREQRRQVLKEVFIAYIKTFGSAPIAIDLRKCCKILEVPYEEKE